MARKSSGVEDFIVVAARLPWWGCLIAAVLSYGLLHFLAGIADPKPQGLEEFGGVVLIQFIKVGANFGQYILPVLFSVAAILSFIKTRNQNSLFKAQQSIKDIRKLSWQQFEDLISEAYRRKGFSVRKTPGGADGGVDIEIEKDKRKFLVQCKHWKAKQVGVKEVRELKGVVATQNAYGGVLITSGTFTTQAIAEASTAGIELIDGRLLVRLIPKLNQIETPDAMPLSIVRSTPTCPKCGGVMTKRIARRGSNPGNQFWGCIDFPKCKGTMDISY